MKRINASYLFKLNPEIIDQHSYKYKFWDNRKRNKDCQIDSPFSQLIGKGFNFEREVIQGMNLIVLLNEEKKFVEPFFFFYIGVLKLALNI